MIVAPGKNAVSAPKLLMQKVIANLDLVLVGATGEKKPVSIKIGVPYEIANGKGADFAKCPVAFEGLNHRISDIAGEDTFQALTLAINFIRTVLLKYIDEGYTIFMGNGSSQFEFEPYFKGFGH